MHIKKTLTDRIFDVFNVSLMIVLLVIFAWPLWIVIISSFSDPAAVSRGEVLILPKGFTFNAYIEILKYKQIWVGYGNTIFYTLVGTALNMVMSILFAYPMADKSFALKKPLMVFFMISMYFGGGLIPMFLLLKNLHLINTRLIYILLGAISIYNALIIRSYFQSSIPSELGEAATLDGCGKGMYLIKVVLPLSKPVFAVVGLYYAVGHWNNYTKGLYYIYDQELYPLQNVLRELLVSSKMLQDLLMTDPELYHEALKTASIMKYAVIIAAALPMMIVYPFIQKYFVKGVMVGAVKG